MPTTTIKCVRSNGSPARGIKVAIGFEASDHLLSSGLQVLNTQIQMDELEIHHATLEKLTCI